MKFLCEQCKAKYQIADEKAAGKTVRMKCRKCGYLIEVRAAVTESTAPTDVADAPAGPGGQRPAAARHAPRPAAPRAAPLATSLASAKPPAKPTDRPAGALAGAFKSSVQREDETSAPFDMSDLSPGDEWYVAINGVPVGPIRIAEVRRKAALGAVTDDSLCWQEGLDEWRPVRAFPELSAIVREAATTGRTSLTPSPGEVRTSHLPPARAASNRPSANPPAPAGRPPARPVTAPLQPTARSNVVPITSRLATAERIDDLVDDQTQALAEPPVAPPPPRPEPAIHADPFAMAAPPAGFAAAIAPSAIAAPAADAMPSLAPPVLPRKAPPWMAIAMVAAATAFGITAAIAIFMRPPPAPPTVIVQGPGAPAAPTSTTATPVPTAAGTDTTTPDPSGTSSPSKGPVAMGGPGKPAPTASAAPGHGPLDLHGLTGNAIAPTDDPGSEGPKAPGQCFSSGQVQQVIGLHQAAIKRSCWERNPTTRPTVNVNVALTIGPDGTPQSVSSTAEEASVAKCVENDVHTWRFPQMGCTQQTAFSFHFVRQ